MRRFQLALCTGSLALFLCAIVTGCGRKADDDEPIVPSKGKTTAGKTVVAGTKLTPIKATEYGTIKGKVAWAGEKGPSLQEKINFTKDTDYCIQGKEVEITQQAFRVGDNGGLGNVYVWIEPAESDKYFEVPADQLKAFEENGPKGKLTVHQPHCAFMPHCSILFPSYYKDGVLAKTGQKFIVSNDAKVSHNANIKSTENAESNETITPGSTYPRPLKKDDEAVRVSCGIHPWMLGYVRVFTHPYAALSQVGANLEKRIYEDRTAASFGTYEITGVPVGAKVKLKAWHEALGFLGDPAGKVIELKKDQSEDFTAKK